MDALALLCNLHGDGPDTLDSLRAIGCTDLSELLSFEVDDLAKALEIEPAASRRFLSEARGLEDRIAGGTPTVAPAERGARDDREEEGPVYRGAPTPAPMISPDAVDEVEDALGEVPDGRDLDFSMTESDPEGSHPVIQAVLETWRELDDEEPDRVEEEAAREPERVLVPRTPEPVQEETRQPFAQVELEGISREDCARLADAGLATVEEFLASDPLEVSKTSGVAYTRVMRAQFLARRAAAPRASEPTAGPFA